jgi:hypothetical protein
LVNSNVLTPGILYLSTLTPDILISFYILYFVLIELG